jgi:hypothetical protein
VVTLPSRLFVWLRQDSVLVELGYRVRDGTRNMQRQPIIARAWLLQKAWLFG